MALHPSAHSVLVGFVDKLRLFTVLLDDLKCASLRTCVLLCFTCMHGARLQYFPMDGLSRGGKTDICLRGVCVVSDRHGL